jgi:hypothetical protein
LNLKLNKMLSFCSILLAVAAFATIASAIPTAPPSNDIVNTRSEGGPASDFYFKRGHVNAERLLRLASESDAEINVRGYGEGAGAGYGEGAGAGYGKGAGHGDGYGPYGEGLRNLKRGDLGGALDGIVEGLL